MPRLKTKKNITIRWHYVIGHLQANLKMAEDDRYCIDIIRQNQAVIAAIKKINELILKNHLDTCVTTAIRGRSQSARQKVLAEIVQIFKEDDQGKS